MQRVHLVLAACAIATVCYADQFVLKDDKGKTFGPFETRAGNKVAIGGDIYEIATVVTPRQKVIETLKRIVIPEVEFRHAAIHDVVAFLEEAAIDNDPEKKGVPIVVSSAVAPLVATSESLTNISFSARRVSLCSLLKTLRTITDLTIAVDETGVRILAPDEPEGPILHRSYAVAPTYVERVRQCGTGVERPDNALPDLKDYFAKMGIRWPTGSGIIYNSMLGRVFVANTAANLARFEHLLPAFQSTYHQVDVEAHFVRFDLTSLPRTAKGRADVSAVTSLWTNGCGTLLAAPRVMTRCGGPEASVRGVTEVIYPTSFGTNAVSHTNALPASGAPVVPQDFATREIGPLFTVQPEVSPDGSMISLMLTPSFVEPPSWRDYGYDLPAGSRQVAHVPMEQPFFHCIGVNTQVTVTNGQTVLIGGGVPTADGKGLVYCFVTTTLVGDDGKPLKTVDVSEPEDPCDF